MLAYFTSISGIQFIKSIQDTNRCFISIIKSLLIVYKL